jgi:hypothetical protein
MNRKSLLDSLISPFIFYRWPAAAHRAKPLLARLDDSRNLKMVHDRERAIGLRRIERFERDRLRGLPPQRIAAACDTMMNVPSRNAGRSRAARGARYLLTTATRICD